MNQSSKKYMDGLKKRPTEGAEKTREALDTVKESLNEVQSGQIKDTEEILNNFSKESNSLGAKATPLLERTNELMCVNRSALETYHEADSKSRLPDLGAAIRSWGKEVEKLGESLQKGRQVVEETRAVLTHADELFYEEEEEKLPSKEGSVVDSDDSDDSSDSEESKGSEASDGSEESDNSEVSE